MADLGTRNRLLLAVLSIAVPAMGGQQPLARRFRPAAEERYQVTVGVKAETHTVSTAAAGGETYVTPVVHAAEVSLRWRSVKRILDLHGDGSADTEETITPAAGCQQARQPEGRSDPRLQSSLEAVCAALLKAAVLRAVEDPNGLLREAPASPLCDLGEAGPQLLALWLRRAIRPSVIFPALPFEAGAKVERPLRPGEPLRNARGSESAEWLEAREESPSAALHVVQHLSWDGGAPGAADAQPGQEEFFADSLTTVSLLDGGVLRASRSASRATSHRMDAVPGLPVPPEFSSKLTVSVAVERLP